MLARADSILKVTWNSVSSPVILYLDSGARVVSRYVQLV